MLRWEAAYGVIFSVKDEARNFLTRLALMKLKLPTWADLALITMSYDFQLFCFWGGLGTI